MGLVYQHIRIANAARPELEEIDANALVDSGAAELCVTKLVALQLKLEPIAKRTVTYADGRKESVDYVGPVRVEVFGRTAFVGAVVTPGDQVLLGAMPMQGMDVLVDPARHQLVPNPDFPDTPGALMMGFRTGHYD